MKSLLVAVVLTLFAAPAMACSFDTDCSVGSKCVKPRGQMNGICAGGMNPGNNSDRQPFRDPMDITGKGGNTCSFDPECGPGGRCAKERGQISGVCIPK